MKNRFFNSIVLKDIKEFNIIILVLIGIFLVGISGYSSYVIFSDEIVSNNEIKGFVKKQITGADTIIEKKGTDGIVAESHPATSQLVATTDYRYTGANPNNYIKFNDEVWRIIGVFDVDDGTGKLEKRIKIIRSSLGNMAWDTSNANDWLTSSLRILLNDGDYYNRTGSYATYGLTEKAKTMIADAKWYLGGTLNYTSSSNGLASHFYSYERGTTVYTGRSISWIGKVGLMYVSDYGYATSGDSSVSRSECLLKELANWRDVSGCSRNDWLYNSGLVQWVIEPFPNLGGGVFIINKVGSVSNNSYIGGKTISVSPSVYLKKNVQIVDGNGTYSKPYIISE